MKYNVMLYDNFDTDTGIITPIKGYKIKLKQIPQFQFFYYRSPRFGFYICEFSSGFAAGIGDTLKEAKKNVIRAIKTIGIRKTKKMIKETILKYGIANMEGKQC